MHIWVDADACPAVIKDILYRAAQRWQRPLTMVANQMLRTPPSPLIRAVQVLDKNASVLNPRGERYTADTIRERLSMRDMMEELRSAGVDTGGPATFSQADRRAFANALDRLMVAQARSDASAQG
ncbi:MAG TPA: DUF188 domain-containing protein [Bordetella sp.]